MDKKKLSLALKKAIESSNKRNFKQTVDLIITLKDLDLKKPDNQVDIFMPLPHTTGKQVKICGLVGPELKDSAQKEFDFVITADEFPIYAKDKKKAKKVAEEYDYFVAQSNLMPQVAQAFGRILGPKSKMPNPKSGCVVLPTANLSQLKAKLKNTIRVMVKTILQYQTAIGKEDQSEEQLLENANAIYSQLTHNLPGEENNIKDVFIKLTMGPAVKIDSVEEAQKKEVKK